MNKIFVIRNVDTGEFYGGVYNSAYCKPTDHPSSDYSAWTVDLGNVKHYESLITAKSSAKRLATEFNKVIKKVEKQKQWFVDKIQNPNPDGYGGPWMKDGIPTMKVNIDQHDWILEAIKGQQPNDIEGVALTIGILSEET